MTYYNTTHESGAELAEFQAKAASQEDVILEFFRIHHYATPSEVWAKALPRAPLTSVRRAITNLTNDGFLEKTEQKRNGVYGRREYCWKLKPEQRDLPW